MNYWLLPRGVIGYPFVVRSNEKLQLHFNIAQSIHFELNSLYHENGLNKTRIENTINDTLAVIISFR